MKRIRIFSMMVAVLLLATFVASASPVYAASGTITATLVGGNPLNANTTRTFRTVATNTGGSSTTYEQSVNIGIGVFFPSPLPTGCVQNNPTMRKVLCTYTLGPGLSKTIDFAMWIGEGYFDEYTDAFFTFLDIPAGPNMDHDDVWSTPLGSNFVDYYWDASVGESIGYANVSTNTEYIVMKGDWGSGVNRIGRLVWRAADYSAITITGMSMCEVNTSDVCISGNLGSWAWTDSTHTATTYDYSSWGGNKRYKISATYSVNGLDGQGGQSWQVFMHNVSGTWRKDLDSHQSWYLV